MMKKIAFILFVLLTPILLSQPVHAESTGAEDLPWERFSLQVGGFISFLNSDVRIGSKELGVGLDIDVEEALGLETSLSVFRVDVLYRFGRSRRHRWDLAYFDFRRDASKVLESDIDFNGRTFPIGTTVESLFNLRIFRLSYSYSFFQDDRFDFSVSGGFYIIPIEVGIRADGVGDEKMDIAAPLPTIGFRADLAITPKLFIIQGMEVFWLKFQNYQGSILSTHTAIEYRVWKHIGFGLGYDAFRLTIEAEGEDYPTIDFVGSIKTDYAGLLLYAKFFY